MKTLRFKKSAIAAAVGIAGMFCVGSAGAYTWSLGPCAVGALNGCGTSFVGATTVDFNSPGLGPFPLPSGSNFNYTGGAVVNGTTGNHAPPSGDTSNYYSVGPFDGTANGDTFSGNFNYTGAPLLYYFGFNYSSPDLYNSVDIMLGDTILQTFTGVQLATPLFFPANGDQATSRYLNVVADNAGEFFDHVRFNSTANAFETDNHAFAAIPEPSEYAMLLAGLGLMGFIARRRTQAA